MLSHPMSYSSPLISGNHDISNTYKEKTNTVKQITHVFTHLPLTPMDLHTCPATRCSESKYHKVSATIHARLLGSPPLRPKSKQSPNECSASHSIPKLSGRASEATWRDPASKKAEAGHLGISRGRPGACGTSTHSSAGYSACYTAAARLFSMRRRA
jgi:hypothetical protein